MKHTIKKLVAIAGLAALVGTSARAQDYSRNPFHPSFSFSINAAQFNVANAPASYGQVPPHPDDVNVLYGPNHPVKTRDAPLKGTTYNAAVLSLGAEISPIPVKFLDRIKVGYSGTFFSQEDNEQQTTGIKNIQWYEYGANAATYSRLLLPAVENSFYVALDLPMKINEGLGAIARVGISQDSANTKITKGWDRFGKEEAYQSDKLELTGNNLFAKLGVFWCPRGQDADYATKGWEVYGFWKQNNLEGSTSEGPVELGGDLFGIGGQVNF
ncbi:hypothetical protein KA107_03535 [Candidatus Pacearchaeota archaeon]|nr:hypothetical protein [Candidatus Pacearchaeota archaeon]